MLPDIMSQLFIGPLPPGTTRGRSFASNIPLFPNSRSKSTTSLKLNIKESVELSKILIDAIDSPGGVEYLQVLIISAIGFAWQAKNDINPNTLKDYSFPELLLKLEVMSKVSRPNEYNGNLEYFYLLTLILSPAGILARPTCLLTGHQNDQLQKIFDNMIATNKLKPEHFTSPLVVVAALLSISATMSVATIKKNWNQAPKEELYSVLRKAREQDRLRRIALLPKSNKAKLLLESRYNSPLQLLFKLALKLDLQKPSDLEQLSWMHNWMNSLNMYQNIYTNHHKNKNSKTTVDSILNDDKNNLKFSNFLGFTKLNSLYIITPEIIIKGSLIIIKYVVCVYLQNQMSKILQVVAKIIINIQLNLSFFYFQFQEPGRIILKRKKVRNVLISN